MSKNKGGKIKIKPKTTDSLNKMVYKKRNCLAASKETERKQTRKETKAAGREKSGASELLAPQ